ncbi:hypothetical protein FACUT_13857 [Fusarium acutatum]|uniref:JmjC domain-containing protein n=1 Tax=Fusarium acutatum TaxID=78861 RepID=A0A8H4JAN7_9HYPO|nr:hypothetical protein FACUT_13857 [Fusarium acutatum]
MDSVPKFGASGTTEAGEAKQYAESKPTCHDTQESQQDTESVTIIGEEPDDMEASRDAEDIPTFHDTHESFQSAEGEHDAKSVTTISSEPQPDLMEADQNAATICLEVQNRAEEHDFKRDEIMAWMENAEEVTNQIAKSGDDPVPCVQAGPSIPARSDLPAANNEYISSVMLQSQRPAREEMSHPPGTIFLSNTMSTQESLTSIIHSFHTGALELSSSLSALCNELRDKCPKRKPPTRQQPETPAAKLPMTVLDAWDVLDQLDALRGQVQVIILQAKEAQNVMVTSHEQVMDNATNSIQMDTRSETSYERQVDTQLETSEREATSDSQSSQTSSSQPVQTFDDPQPVESEDVIMTGDDLAAANSPPDSPKEGGDDINVRLAVTPSPANRSARADLKTSREGTSFARSHSVVTESSAASMTVDTSPAGSVATHITWPESSARSADGDEAMLDVDDTRDSMQKRQPDLGGLKRINDSSSGQDLATGDKPSSPDAPSLVTDDRTGQPTQSPGVSERASSSEPQSPTAHTEAERHDDRLASPPVNGDIRPNEDSHADDFTKDMESAMDMLAAAAEQGHSPGSGDEQRTSDQQRESPSAGPPDKRSDTASTPPAIQFTPSNGARSSLPPTTVLTPADMERLVPKLAEMERDGETQHFSVPRRNVDLAHMKEMVKTTDERWQTTSTRYVPGPKGMGYASIYVSDRRPPIHWEGFTTQCQRPTIPEIVEIFEKFALDPPQEDIPYYTGNLDILPEERLDPGPEITGNPELKDLHVPYHHIGGHGSGNRIHREDFITFRSYNEVYFGTGYKLWLAIEEDHIAKFNAFVKANWNCNECDLFVSHQCLLLAPSTLDEAGIRYIVAAVGCGEAFYTLPGQPHAIINFGHCAAHSINYIPPGEKIDLSEVTTCTDDGMYAVGKKYGQTTASVQELAQTNKRKAHQQLSQVAPKKTRACTAPQRELVEIEQGLAEIHYRPIQIDHQHPSAAELNVYKQVAAVRSTIAIQQFITLVQDWKNEEAPLHIDKSQDNLDQSVESVKFFEGRTKLSKFGLRLTQRKLAREADMVKGPIQKQLKPGFLDQLAADHCMTKDRLKDHIQEGRKWNFICQSHDGLLPFILLDSKNPFGIKKQNWTNLYHEDFTKEAIAFRSLLDDKYIKNLCEAGRIFEERVLEKIFNGSVSDTGGFLWEENELDPASDNIDELLKQTRVVA